MGERLAELRNEIVRCALAGETVNPAVLAECSAFTAATDAQQQPQRDLASVASSATPSKTPITALSLVSDSKIKEAFVQKYRARAGKSQVWRSLLLKVTEEFDTTKHSAPIVPFFQSSGWGKSKNLLERVDGKLAFFHCGFMHRSQREQNGWPRPDNHKAFTGVVPIQSHKVLLWTVVCLRFECFLAAVVVKLLQSGNSEERTVQIDATQANYKLFDGLEELPQEEAQLSTHLSDLKHQLGALAGNVTMVWDEAGCMRHRRFKVQDNRPKGDNTFHEITFRTLFWAACSKLSMYLETTGVFVVHALVATSSNLDDMTPDPVQAATAISSGRFFAFKVGEFKPETGLVDAHMDIMVENHEAEDEDHGEDADDDEDEGSGHDEDENENEKENENKDEDEIEGMVEEAGARGLAGVEEQTAAFGDGAKLGSGEEGEGEDLTAWRWPSDQDLGNAVIRADKDRVWRHGRPMWASVEQTPGSAWKHRFMFAALKLLGEDKMPTKLNETQVLAVLYARIAGLVIPVQRSESMVSCHMATALCWHDKNIIAQYVSEPALAGGSRFVLAHINSSMCAPEFLAQVKAAMSPDPSNAGDAGEIAACCALLEVCDRLCDETEFRGVRVDCFLKKLVGEDWRELFGEGFRRYHCGRKKPNHTLGRLDSFVEQGWVSFNHFVRVEDTGDWPSRLRWALMRCAAIICPRGFGGLDLIIPVDCGRTFGSAVSCIIIQIKNTNPRFPSPYRLSGAEVIGYMNSGMFPGLYLGIRTRNDEKGQGKWKPCFIGREKLTPALVANDLGALASALPSDARRALNELCIHHGEAVSSNVPTKLTKPSCFFDPPPRAETSGTRAGKRRRRE